MFRKQCISFKKGIRGRSSRSLFTFFATICFVLFVLEISGGGKGSDEEHITYSGGKEIFDLLQCG